MTRRLVLASASPTRLRVLELAGFAPEVVVSGVDESGLEALTPHDLVAVLARRKAEAVVGEQGDALVLACDSVVSLGDLVLGKPGSVEEARAWWQGLRGGSAAVWSGHHLVDGATGRAASRVTAAQVHFAVPSDAELDRYLATEEPWGAAGAFRLDGRASAWVVGVAGDPGTVHGVSIPALRTLLAELGVDVCDLWVA